MVAVGLQNKFPNFGNAVWNSGAADSKGSSTRARSEPNTRLASYLGANQDSVLYACAVLETNALYASGVFVSNKIYSCTRCQYCKPLSCAPRAFVFLLLHRSLSSGFEKDRHERSGLEFVPIKLPQVVEANA